MSLRKLIATTALFNAAQAQGAYDPWTSWSSVPPLSIMTLWIPDSEPVSLEAKLKSFDPVATVTYWDVSCPTAASPENDACRQASIYPAEIYHTVGSVWGGTTTYAVDDSTTTWRCTPGQCDKTIVSDGSTRTESTTYDPCYVIAHHLPLVVTEGAELRPSQHYMDWYRDVVPSDINKDHESQLSEAGCPSSKTTMFAEAVTTSGPTTTPSGGLESPEAETRSGPTGTDITPTTSGGSAESSEDANSGSSRRSSNGLGFMSLGLAVAASLVMV